MISRFRIANMDCAAEEELVRMSLHGLDGISRIAVDLHKREVAIEHNLEPTTIAAALESLDLGTTHLGDGGTIAAPVDEDRERTGLRIALVINAILFVGELGFGLVSRSMGLIADGLDMGADASVYALSLAAVGKSGLRKKRLARTSGYLQFGLAVVGLVEVLRRFITESGPPETTTMIVVSLLALAGNIATMAVISRIKTGEAHIQASWIFTANDIKVNALVIVAAIAVAVTDSAFPDLAAGAFIFAIVANGARRILRIAT